MGEMEYSRSDVLAMIKEARNEESTRWAVVCSLQSELAELEKDPIIDINQSVLWNREEFARRQRALKSKITKAKNFVGQAYLPAEEAIKSLCRTEYGVGERVSELCFSNAYEDEHSSGMEDVMERALSYAAFASDVMEACGD